MRRQKIYTTSTTTEKMKPCKIRSAYTSCALFTGTCMSQQLITTFVSLKGREGKLARQQQKIVNGQKKFLRSTKENDE